MTFYTLDDLKIGASSFDKGRPLIPARSRVHIVALGDVGMTMLIGLRLLGGDVVERIGLYDINEKNVERLTIEMNQVRYPFGGSSMLPPVGAVDEAKLFDCDVFIFCATKGVPPVGAGGDVRMAQLEANKSLVSYYGALAKKAAYKGLVCVVSDPVDPLCAAFYQAAGCAPGQIQGYGLGVMDARACYFAGQDSRFAQYLTDGRAFGPHGDDLVLANSLAHYDDALSKELTAKVTKANMDVRALGYKPYIAPALSSAALSILLTLRRQWHYGSVYIGDGKSGAYVGMKNIWTPEGFAGEDVLLCEPLFGRIRYAYMNLIKLS